ncbi:MAG: hypothetical protein U9N30_03105 [Campylobacterota bacterium]|nr:hypothetical protein [Campylobacterota bacterium]
MSLILLLAIFIALELFESNWQKADTFLGMIKNNYIVYEKSIFLYFLLNPTFFYVLFLSIALNNFSFLMCTLIVLKFADISFRLHLISKINKDESIDHLIPMDFNVSFALRYTNAMLYPITFILALL